MSYFTMLRTLFLLFVLGIFLFQMYNSVKKYIEGPVVQETKTTSWDAIQKPVIYACQANQYNQHARQYGYQSLSKFLIGEANGRLVGEDWNTANYTTWKGVYNNLTFQKAQALFYDFDDSKHALLAVDMDQNNKKLLDQEIMFFPTIGFCSKIKNMSTLFSFRTNNKYMIYLVDPLKDSRVRIDTLEDATVYLGPTDEMHFNTAAYELEITLQDLILYEGRSCTDYSKYDTSYGKCIEKSLKDKLVQVYGCLPPWFIIDNSKSTCTEVKRPGQHMIDEIANEIKRLELGFEMQLFHNCLPPCLEMRAKLRRKSVGDMVDSAHVVIEANKEVVIYTDVYAFDMFNMMIDIGSALSLWLGLSALSSFDSIIELLLFWIKNRRDSQYELIEGLSIEM